MTEGVKNFLSRLGLDGHLEMFMAKGFDSEDDLPYLQDDDLDAMYITDQDERSKLLEAAPHYKPSKEYILYDWLRSKDLDHYFISFVQSELIDLPEIARLNLPDEDLYDELEITLPGHKRRLERAVRSLAKKHRTTLPTVTATTEERESEDIPPSPPEPEMPVAYGRWGKPRCLIDAKYDFLLIDATVVSTIDSRDRVHIEFMVDSGSDVVTLRQEVLDTMDLQLIGPIHSKGVHGSKVKNLYKANVLIGDRAIEVEVMGESYDSVGSRVLRHFRHYINGSRHIWLKGDFEEDVGTTDMNIKADANIPTQIGVEKDEIFHESLPLQESMQEEDEEEKIAVDTEKLSSVSDIEEESAVISLKLTGAVQKDHVKLNGPSDKEHTEVEIVMNGAVTDIKFSFEKKAESETKEQPEDEENVEDEKANDETDKLFGNTADIIDLRPIINANRKRHASNPGGIEPYQEDKRARNRRSERRDRRLLAEKNVPGTRPARDTKAQVIKREFKENHRLRTVLKQRSVYYQSQETSQDQQDQ